LPTDATTTTLSPISGILLGGGRQKMAVAVDVAIAN